MTIATRGIKQAEGLVVASHAVGDTAGIYAYVSSDGGPVADSDEGVTGATFAADESNMNYFHGQVQGAPTGTGGSPTLEQTAAVTLHPSSVAIANNVLTLTFPAGTSLPVVGTSFLITEPSGPNNTIFLNNVTLTVEQIGASSISAVYNYMGSYPSAPYSGLITTIAGAPWTTDGGILLNMSARFYAGNITGDEASFGVAGTAYPLYELLMHMPVTSTGAYPFAATTAWGMVTSEAVPDGFAITNPGTSMDINTPMPTPLTVALQMQDAENNYIGFTAGSIVTVAGSNYSEQCPITAVGAVTGSTHGYHCCSLSQ